MRNPPWLSRLAFLTWLLAVGVILLGAFTRLSDAGLGCPDWPGCYGQFIAPSSSADIAQASEAFPSAPVDVTKARTEMTHRYFAETLGSLIVALALLSFWKRRELTLPQWLMPMLVVLVLFQGLLGMWTVTLRLLPLAVMGHLLGGFSTLSLLWLSWLSLRLTNFPSFSAPPTLRLLAWFTLGMVILQIFLGGWTSANYAALICPDFPTCQGQWWPTVNFERAFNLLGGMGLDNPLSYMDTQGRTTIHLMHRVGAMITLILGLSLSLKLTLYAKTQSQLTKQRLTRLSIILLSILLLQVGLGVSNILFSLPLPVAVAHNGIGALLLLAVITIIFTLQKAAKKRANG